MTEKEFATWKVKSITAADLRTLPVHEGLVLQGCGGDLKEWVNGINETLTDEGILLDGAKFTDVYTFEHDGLTNMLFSMDDVKLDVGKMAMWRLQSHGTFGGTWLSDYVPNKLGVERDTSEQPVAKEKPDCPIIGADGNIFNIMGIASRTLKRNGMPDEAKEMMERVQGSGSYDEALSIITEYVTPVEQDSQTGDMGMGGIE